jgi:lipopolysaccharide/colanic/teichoic acid biosynthesis glycosyltransferase
MAKFFRTAVGDFEFDSGYESALEPALNEVVIQASAVSRANVKRVDSVMTAKRLFDIAVASLAIVILFPFIVIVALLIKVESNGPIFFVQERIGLNRRRVERRRRMAHTRFDERSGRERRKRENAGRPFKIFKFRTMVQSAEAGGPVLACENDPRITRLGRLMRKARIDEIPQFVNVIKGDMSIIGPRPERSYFINKVKEDVPEFTMRLMVKPGITGLAQVEDGYTKTLDEMKKKLFYDLKYIANLSVAQEIRILCKTFYVILTGKGAC